MYRFVSYMKQKFVCIFSLFLVVDILISHFLFCFAFVLVQRGEVWGVLIALVCSDWSRKTKC